MKKEITRLKRIYEDLNIFSGIVIILLTGILLLDIFIGKLSTQGFILYQVLMISWFFIFSVTGNSSRSVIRKKEPEV